MMYEFLFSILVFWFFCSLLQTFANPIEVENSKIAGCLGHDIVLYPFILYVGEPSEITRSHEYIHVAQIKRDGIMCFYLTYIVDYALNRFMGMSHSVAYLNIPYEVEAYQNEKAVKKRKV